MDANSFKPDRPKHLPQYVGFSEVQEALGVSRRTVERMVRAGTFPQPVQLSSNRVGWQVETVRGWMSERQRGLTAKAVARPEDLSPDEFDKTMRSLAADFLSKETGKSIEPSELSLSIGTSTGSDEAMDLGPGLVEHFDGAFDHFEFRRALIAAGRLFPALRQFLSECSVGLAEAVFTDPDLMRELGNIALIDQLWTLNETVIEQSIFSETEKPDRTNQSCLSPKFPPIA
jgi:prophage regulatory protein